MKNKLNLSCAIGNTGYGITSLNTYKELRLLDVDITLFPIGTPTVDSENEKSIIVEDTSKQESYSKNSSYLKIWHQFDLANRIGNGHYSVLTFFEIDKLKNMEINMLNNTDLIFVASKWAKEILEQNNIKTKCVVSPLGADLKIFGESNTIPKPENQKDKYIFINIGKWELRKGHDVLVEIFNNAFSSNDDVELWMVNHNPFLSDSEQNEWVKLYKSSPLGDKIKCFPRLNTHADLAKLISISDCGIFPARAEGWNNEIIEVMAMNKPVILTNYSAHTEYATKDNAFLIEIDNLVPAIDNKFFDGFGKWADFGDNQIDQAVEHMRLVYKNKIRTNEMGLLTSKQFTWDKTAKIIYDNIFG